MKRVLLVLALAAAGCDGKKESKDDGSISTRPLKAAHREVLVRFADAVVKKDYRAAYELTAAKFRTDVGWEEFEKSIRRYRDSVESLPTHEIGATEDDPKDYRDGVIELFVPAEDRAKVLEEGVIHFTVKGKTSEDDGGWSIVCWIVEENGAAKILNYVQDD